MITYTNPWEVWEHLEREFLHGHAEWVETRNLTARNFDSYLRTKVMALWNFPICSIEKPCILQCFLPTCYMTGGAMCKHMNVMTFTWLITIGVWGVCSDFMAHQCSVAVPWKKTTKKLVRGEPERAPNTWETGNGFICIYIIVCLWGDHFSEERVN